MIGELLLLCGVLLVTLVACGGGAEQPDNTDPTGDVEAGTTARVTVMNVLGAPLVGVQVYIYQDSSLTELVAFAQTDAEGNITVPSLGAESPLSSCIIVDFPEPVCPMMPVTRPSGMVRVTSSSASISKGVPFA